MKARRETNRRNRLLRAGVSVLSVAVALGITLALSSWLYPIVTPPFFVAVVVSAWLGGREAGLLATALSTLIVDYLFIEPLYSLQVADFRAVVQLSQFTIAAGGVSWLIQSRQMALKEARANYQSLESTMKQEAETRLKGRQTEEALRQSEARLHAVAANLPKGAVFILDHDLRYLLAEGEALQDAGMKSEDLVGKTIWEALDPDLAAHYEPFYRRALDGEPFSLEYESHDRHYISHGIPLYNDQSEVYAVLAMSYDISDRKQAEEQLRESERFLKGINETAPNLLYIFDLNERRNVYIGPQIFSMLGIVPTDMQALNSQIFAQLFHPDDLEDIEQHHNRMRAALQDDIFTIEYRVKHSNGKWLWLTSRDTIYVRDAQGKPTQIIGSAIDITDRKQAEALLRQSESRFRLMVESAKEYAIITLDLNGLVTGWNAGAQRLLGYAEAEIVGRSGRTIFTPEDNERGQAEREMQLALTQGRAENERWHLRQDGSRFWGSGLMMPLQDEADTTQGFVKIMQDKTAQKQTEAQREQLLQQEQATREAAENANRIKDEFLAVLSHELRSPLNPILGWAKLLQSGRLDAAKTAQAIATIERNATLQAQLIEDLLDVSRILRGKLGLTVTSVNLATIIRAALETVRLAAEAKNIEVRLIDQPEESGEGDERITSSPPSIVQGDATRLQQVVWNLLSNAIKFTPPGGRVEVRLEEMENREWEMGNREMPNHSRLPTPDSPSYAQITVIDTGKGISPDFLPHVFEYFRQEDGATTRKLGGLGLGLAIVRHLVEMHGGTVTAASAGEGRGATFTVQLPLLGSRKSGVGNWENVGHAPLSAHHLPLAGLHILVVDDDPDSRDFITFVLEQAGASVTTASTASEGFLVLSQAPPDVLLSDIGMPDVDGYMLMQQVRALPLEQGGQVNAIALTAYAGEFNQQQALQAGFQQHISKPIEPAALVRAIANLTEGTG